MTLQEYLDYIGWSLSDLSRAANVDFITARKALSGERISRRSARAIAQALADALNRPIHVGDIVGLQLA
jgi:hypothetical protein